MRKRAFTLIELLVVIAVIALLIGILVPSLAVVRRKAQTARCLTSVRGISQSVQLYVADWGVMFPFNAAAGGSWVQVLGNRPAGVSTDSGYGASAKMSTCPSANAPTQYVDPTVGTAYSQWYGSIAGPTILGSYGLNGWAYALPNPVTDSSSWTTLTSVVSSSLNSKYFNIIKPNRPSEMPLIFDANWRHLWASPTDLPPQAPFNLDNNGPTSISAITPPATIIHPLTRAVMNRHDKGINVAFVDGHAETVKLPQLWTLYWSRGWTQPSTLPTMPLH